MKELVAFAAEGGEILVEIENTGSAESGRRKASPDGIPEKAQKSFTEAIKGISPIARSIVDQMSILNPDSFSVELGIKLNAQAGVVLASTATEGHCKITINWKKKD